MPELDCARGPGPPVFSAPTRFSLPVFSAPTRFSLPAFSAFSARACLLANQTRCFGHCSVTAQSPFGHYSGTIRALFSPSLFALRLALFSSQASSIRVRVTLRLQNLVEVFEKLGRDSEKLVWFSIVHERPLQCEPPYPGAEARRAVGAWCVAPAGRKCLCPLDDLAWAELTIAKGGFGRRPARGIRARLSACGVLPPSAGL